MNAFESPTQFKISKSVDGVKVCYADLFEIAQGGPEVGTISINGKFLEGQLFGGPWLYSEGYIYIPRYARGVLGWGFKLVKIDVGTLHAIELTKKRDLIFLEKIEGEHIFFFENVTKTDVRKAKIH